MMTKPPQGRLPSVLLVGLFLLPSTNTNTNTVKEQLLQMNDQCRTIAVPTNVDQLISSTLIGRSLLLLSRLNERP